MFKSRISIPVIHYMVSYKSVFPIFCRAKQHVLLHRPLQCQILLVISNHESIMQHVLDVFFLAASSNPQQLTLFEMMKFYFIGKLRRGWTRAKFYCKTLFLVSFLRFMTDYRKFTWSHCLYHLSLYLIHVLLSKLCGLLCSPTFKQIAPPFSLLLCHLLGVETFTISSLSANHSVALF